MKSSYKYDLLFFLGFIMSLPSIFAQKSVSDVNKKKDHQVNLPKTIESVSTLPPRDKLWIFVMAGQSNMAGRAFITPKDTIPNPRILTVTQDNKWALAKEPLHRYKPKLMGLDCGRSFAEEILKNVNDSVHIALLPCAVGGTSIKEWLGDSLRKNVYLYTNLREKVNFANKYGTIKGILWHQGESDAKDENTVSYQDDFLKLIQSFREDIGNKSLPIIIGELGKNINDTDNQANRKLINQILKKVSEQDKDMGLVLMRDLTTFDGYHFDRSSVQMMGKRYAIEYMKIHNDF